jgi:large subunit ribosomal protein L17
VCGLITHGRIKTTKAKAKAARSLAEKMITLGKKGTLAARRQAIATLKQEEAVRALFEKAGSYADRNGGYTRILKLGRRISDSSEMVFLEWVEAETTVSEEVQESA